MQLSALLCNWHWWQGPSHQGSHGADVVYVSLEEQAGPDDKPSRLSVLLVYADGRH